MNYERFVIYCFHIETCHVYNITNERLIENKAPIINYDSQQRSKETITSKSVTESDANFSTGEALQSTQSSERFEGSRLEMS